MMIEFNDFCNVGGVFTMLYGETDTSKVIDNSTTLREEERRELNDCTISAIKRVKGRYGFWSENKQKQAMYGIADEMMQEKDVPVSQKIIHARVDDLYKTIK